MVKFNKPLVYPPVVLAHIIDDLKDYFEPKMINKSRAHIHYSAQLNGHSHMGTLTSLATAFSAREYIQKISKDSTLVDASNHMDLLYVTSCPEHGEYEVRISPQSTQLIDFNTSLRNVIKEAKFIDDARQDNAMNLMVDGGDWTGMAFQVMQSLGLMGYGISDLPLRIFSPIIEDWSGAKFSKSLYVKEGTCKDVPEEFLNYVKFQETFGVKGLDITLDESREWIADPKKLFRNYSVEYLKKVYNL